MVDVNPISTSMTPHCRPGCWVGFGSALPLTLSIVGSTTSAQELWNFIQEMKGLWGVLAFLTVGWSVQLTLSVQLLEQSHKQVCNFPQYFFYLKYSNHRALKLSSSCTLELKRVPWRNSPTAAELMLTGAWGLLAKTSGWGADKPGRVSGSKSGVAGEHYLI